MAAVTEIYSVTDEQIQQVRRAFGKDEDGIREDIRILNEWWSKQQHLPKNRDDMKLERILLRNKFRVEQTKVKIDNYYFLRGLYTEFFNEIKDNFETVMEEGNKCQVIPLPCLTDSCERLVIIRVRSQHVAFDFKKVFAYIFMIFELESMHDYSVGNRYVVDWSNFTLNNYKAMELNMMMKGMVIHQEAYSARIMQLDYINAPGFIDLFLKLFKMIIKTKMYEKIKMHENLENFHKTIDPKYLPSDYAGQLKDTDHYHELVRKALREKKADIIMNISEVSDENKRIGKRFWNDLFGIDGTFKKLNVD